MALDLAVLEPGHALGRAGACLEVRKDGKVLDSVPLHRLLTVSVGPGISVSSDLIAALAEQGVLLHVQDRTERPAAVLFAPHPWGGAALKRSQARSLDDGRAQRIATQLIRAKLIHQARLQQVWATYLVREPDRNELKALGSEILSLAPRALEETTSQGLMILEAQGARLHWRGVSLMIPFYQRRYPHAPDLSNQLLNYSYGVLGRIWLGITLRAGLDPHLGVLHADRLGRPGLVLDLMEPWRPWVDRTIVGLIRKGVPLESQQGELTVATRRRLLDALHRTFQVVPERRRMSLRALWQHETRRLARHFHEGGSWAALVLHP